MFLIANSSNQKRYSLQSSATTLGELQRDMDAAGIPYQNLSFTEGLSKNTLMDAESVIPTGMRPKEYNGVTYDAIMLLTNTRKNIASGAYPTDRKLFSEYIKKNNLGDKIKQRFGDNWTRISTNDLVNFFIVEDKKIAKAAAKTSEDKQKLEEVRQELSSVKASDTAIAETAVEEVVTPPTTQLPDIKQAPHAATVEWFYDGIKKMASDNLLYAEDVVVLANLTTELASRLLESKPKVTDAELDTMLYAASNLR